MSFPEFQEYQEYDNQVDECIHENIKSNGSKRVCLDCCQVLEEEFSYSEQENSSFGTKRTNTTRYHSTSDEKRNIYKDLEKVQLPERVICTANDMYQKIMEKNGKSMIKRGKKRKGVIIVCIHNALRQNGEIRHVSDVAEMFGDEKNADVSYGLKKFGKVFRSSLTEYTTPNDLIRRTITKCGIPIDRYDEIHEFCLSVQGKSWMLKSAVPQSVASAVVYLWQSMNKEQTWACYLGRKQFAEQVRLSEATITKLAKEAARTLGIDVKL